MIHFTKYAEQKFEILDKHQVSFTKKQIEDTVKKPDKVGKKDGIKMVYQKKEDTLKIITFYPASSE